MMEAVRNGAWAKSSGGWVNPYVTDGLVAMWDGEWNAGPGVHSPNATTWVDLVTPGRIVTSNGGDVVWGEKHFLSGKSWFYIEPEEASDIALAYASDSITIQAVLKHDNSLYPNTNYPMFFGSGTNFRFFCRPQDSTFGGWYYSGGYEWMSFKSKIATFLLSSSGYEAFDGKTLSRHGAALHSGEVSGLYIGRANYNAGDNTRYNGPLCGIRIYNRALTSEEIAANCDVDNERFGLT